MEVGIEGMDHCDSNATNDFDPFPAPEIPARTPFPAPHIPEGFAFPKSWEDVGMLLRAGRGFLWELPGLFQLGLGRVWEDLGHWDVPELWGGKLGKRGGNGYWRRPCLEQEGNGQGIPPWDQLPIPCPSMDHSLNGNLEKASDLGFQGILPLLSPSRAMSIPSSMTPVFRRGKGVGSFQDFIGKLCSAWLPLASLASSWDGFFSL